MIFAMISSWKRSGEMPRHEPTRAHHRGTGGTASMLLPKTLRLAAKKPRNLHCALAPAFASREKTLVRGANSAFRAKSLHARKIRGFSTALAEMLRTYANGVPDVTM
ncbi:MAG: hypothetical protein LBU45_04290 [Azoarcus sp.]|jgi:hypothetical protein|nr:hypothetical protein [Azoarcus sp.]